MMTENRANKITILLWFGVTVCVLGVTVSVLGGPEWLRAVGNYLSGAAAIGMVIVAALGWITWDKELGKPRAERAVHAAHNLMLALDGAVEVLIYRYAVCRAWAGKERPHLDVVAATHTDLDLHSKWNTFCNAATEAECYLPAVLMQDGRALLQMYWDLAPLKQFSSKEEVELKSKDLHLIRERLQNGLKKYTQYS